jgi:hypothetical protein
VSQSTDQIWSPIGGVTLESYAKLTRDMAEAGVVGPEGVERWLTGRGVAAGAWTEITTGWSSRMVRFDEVRRRYDELVTAD